MVRCERCGATRHTRDVEDLVVPTTIRLRDAVLAALDDVGADGPGASLTEAIANFRDEAGEALRRELLAEIVRRLGPDRRDVARSIGHALLLRQSDIDRLT